MLAFALEIVPYLHKDETPLAFGTAALIFTTAYFAAALAFSHDSRVWRQSWLLAASLCVLLAVDEALPLDDWISHGIGIRWWKIYAIPVAIGLVGWFRAVPLLARQLPWRSQPVRLLLFGALAWVGAYGFRLIAFANDHGAFAYLDDHLLGHSLITQACFVLEAILKLAGAALLALALARIYGGVRSSRRLRIA